MTSNAAISNPGGAPHPFTLNDLRVHDTFSEEPSSTSALPVAGMVLAAVLAIGAFIWLDPLHFFTPKEAPAPALAFAPSAEPAQPTERQEIIAPPTPVPATKSVEAPRATAPVVQAPQVPAPVVRPRAASIRPESRGNQIDKTNTTVPQASVGEKTAPPALVTKPEEKVDAPIVPQPADDTKNAPKPAAANDQAPATE